MKKTFLFVAVLLSFSVVSLGNPSADELFETPSNYNGVGLKLPKSISVSRFEQFIQRYVDATYQKAFRYIGVDEDFFHGHLLFEAKRFNEVVRLVPRAILYHTQEEAHSARWRGTVDKKYDYLNVTTRNWIQWFDSDKDRDGKKIENARIYLNEASKDPKQFWSDFAEPEEKLYYTIHSKNLDPKKLGFTPYGELQVSFYLDGCDAPKADVYGYRSPFKVQLPNQEVICLSVSTSSPLLELQF